MKQTIKSILAFAAVLLCGGAFAASSPKLLINIGTDTAVDGWLKYNTNGNVIGTVTDPSSSVSFVTEARGSFGAYGKLDANFTTGLYVDIFGHVHSSIEDEVKASLGLTETAFNEDVFKTGFMNAGQVGHWAKISNLDASKSYVIYAGFGVNRTGVNYTSGITIETSGAYASCGAQEYVVTGSNGTGTTVQSRYQSFAAGTAVAPSHHQLMIVRLKDVRPNEDGTVQFKLTTDHAGLNFLAVAEVEDTFPGQFMYSNQLAGSELIPAGSYGAITVAESTGGYKATAYSSNTGLSGTGVGSFAAAGSTKNGRKMIDTHTIAGWFKVDALPTGDATKDIFVMRTGTDSYNGYKVAVDANGVLKIGRTNYNSGNYSWNDNTRVSLTGASGAVASGTWFHLAIAFTYDSNGNYWHLTPVAWINGVAASKSGDDFIDINLNGPGYVDDIRMGAGISAAGIYVDATAISDANIIKAIATDTTYVREVNSVYKATLSESKAFSAITWDKGTAPQAGEAAEITLDANVTLTLDEAITADAVKIIGTDKNLTLTGSSLDAANFAKFDFSGLSGKVIFPSDCSFVPTSAPSSGIAYRFEKDYSSDGFTLNMGAGTYEFKNAKITNGAGSSYKIKVSDGDSVKITNNSWNDLRAGESLEVSGGEVQIGKDGGNSAIWFGDGNTKIVQTGGTITGNATGTTQSGTGNGFLLGYGSTGITQFDVSGGTFQVPNSSLQAYLCNTINLSGTGVMKAKGVFKGNNATTFNVATGAAFELGSLGWKDCPLNLNGGTFKAYETTTMAGATTISSASIVEVVENADLTITGAITGSSRANKLTKTGAGTLILGTLRPVLDVTAGKVRLTATSDELAAGCLELDIPENASQAQDNKVEVFNANGDEMTITDVSINQEGTKVVITLQVNDPITTDCNISDKVTDSTTGVVLIQGPTGESEPITINFDRADYPQDVSFQVTGNVAFTGTVPTTIISYDAAVVYVMSPMTFSVPTGVTAIIKGTVNGDVSLSGAGTIKASDGAVVNGNLNVTGNKFTLEGDLTLGGTGDSHIKGLTGGKLIKTGSGYLKLNNGTGNGHDGYDKYAIDGATIQIDAGMIKVYNENGDARMYNPSFVIGTDGRLENYGWIGAKGTVTIENDTDKVIFTNTNGYGVGGKSAELWGGPNFVKKGAGKATLCVGSHTGDGAEPFGTVNVQAGTLAFDSTVAAAMGAVSGNGKVEMKNTTVDFNVNNQTSGLTSHFIATSGTNTMKWKGGAGNGYNQLCSTDTKADPVITINSGATLNVYGHDYSGWNGNLNEHGWLINNGILVFQSESGTRFFRDHVVFGNGATMKIDHAGTPLLLYGGTGSETSSQFMLESGTASIIAGVAGDNAKLYIGNNTSGGYGDKGMGIAVGSGAVLTIEVPVAGNNNSGETIAKWGAGRVNFTKDMSGLSGNLTLKAGSIGIHSDCNLAEGKIVKDNANKKIDITTEGDYTVYTLVDRDPATIEVSGWTFESFTLDGAVVTMIAGDTVKIPSTLSDDDARWQSQEICPKLNGHAIIIEKEMNWKAPIGRMTITGVPIYLYQTQASKILSGAVVDGTGTLKCNEDNIPVEGPATISCTIADAGSFKLADGATLTVGTELAVGRVLSNVSGKSVKKEEVADNKTKYSLIDTSTDPIEPSDDPAAPAVVIEDVGTGITMAPGAKVKVVLPADATDAQKAEIAAKIAVKYGDWVLKGSLGTNYVAASIDADGTVVLTTTDNAIPAASEIAMSLPTVETQDKVAFTIESPVPGLFYSISSASDPSEFTKQSGAVTTSEGVQATADEMLDGKTISIPQPTTAKVMYFKVSVKATK